MKNTPLDTWVQEMPMNFSLQETTMNHQLKSQNLWQFAPWSRYLMILWF